MKNKLIEYYINKSLKSCLDDYNNCNAIKYIDRALFFDKSNIDAISLKGIYYSNLFNKKKSFECFNKAFEVDSDDIICFYRRGIACSYLQEYEMSLEYFEKCVEWAQNKSDVWNYIAYQYMELEKYDEFFKYINMILEEKEDIWALLQLSSFYLDSSDYKKALKYAMKAYELDSYNHPVLSKLAVIYFYKQQYEESIGYFNLLKKLNGDNLGSNMFEYMVFAYSGEHQIALDGFKKVSNIYFDDYKLIQDYHVIYSRALGAMEMYPEAINLCNEYLEKYNYLPNDAIIETKNVLMKFL